MFKKLVICFLALVLFLFSASKSFAYSPDTTHIALTQEIVEFYNLLHPDKKITREEAEWIIQGSTDEDRDIRAINHFYDPINKIGWTGKGLSSFSASEVRGFTSAFVAPEGADVAPAVQWANDRSLQSQYYSRYGGDRTWTQALEYWVGGKKEDAYYTLGHVLHLVEDMAVPAHTRDDPHPPIGGEESSYEAYADQKWNRSSINGLDIPNKLIRSGTALPSESSIEGYLSSIALYSNRYFFSEDTINDTAYELRINKSNCDNNFCYGIDDRAKTFPLVKIKKTKNGLKYEETYLIEESDLYIFDTHFSRLSEKVVLYGAAVINRFYDEANDFLPSRVSRFNEKSLLGKTFSGRFSFIGELSLAKNKFLSFFANIGDSIANIFSGSPEIGVMELPAEDAVGEIQGVEKSDVIVPNSEEISAAELKNRLDDEYDRATEISKENLNEEDEGVQDTMVDEDESEQVVSLAATSTIQDQSQNTGQSEVSFCPFGSETRSPIGQISPIIINEVAWMGTAVSANDEWIELKNISGKSLDISGYQILDKTEQIKIAFDDNTIIPTGGFYILERTSDETLSNVPADQIYIGALSNTNEGLRLFDAQCRLLDQALANPNWPAGDNSSKGTMERKSDLAWQSSAAQGGTPKAENSVPSLATGGGGSAAAGNGEDSIPEPENATSSTSTATAANHILISEVLYNAEGNDAGNEFVELYNPMAGDLNLNDWSLRLSYSDSTSSDSIASFGGKPEDVTIIKAKSFLLSGLNGNVAGDINRSATLPQVDGVTYTITLFDESDLVVDEVDYESTTAAEKSLERKAFEDNICFSAQTSGEFSGNGCDTNSDDNFETRAVSKPQNSSSLPEPRDAPTAVANFNVGYHFSAPTLTLGWDESQDYTGTTTTVAYEVDEFNTPANSIPFDFDSTSTVLEQVIDEIGRSYEFMVRAVDADGLASTSTVASTTVPSFVDNLHFYRDSRALSTNYLVEFYYDQYPFVPQVSSDGDSWRMVGFYLNKEAEEVAAITNPRNANDPNYQIDGMMQFAYKRCNGSVQNYLSGDYWVLLPDTVGQCHSGGPTSGDLHFDLLEDNHLLLLASGPINDSTFSSSTDYITAAYYDYSSLEGFKLVAVDKTKYYFQNSPPTHNPPSPPADLTVDSYTTDSSTSTVQISWNHSTDLDSLDGNISYESSWEDINWEPIVPVGGANPSKFFAALSVALGSTSTVHIRAVDDLGTVSAVATTTLVLPEAVSNMTPDPSNSYFAVDEAKIENSLLKIKWRLISAPDTNRAFGIIPFLSASGTPASLDNFRSLHRDYGGVSSYPLTVARLSSQCNAAMTPIEDYTLGWQYETHFSAIGDISVSDGLVGQNLEFALYTRNGSGEPVCNLGDAVTSPLFTGLSAVIQ
ncbi:MAG: lamin tail domain-containing protein [Candidatus Jorgensenbacteria bacterium]